MPVICVMRSASIVEIIVIFYLKRSLGLLCAERLFLASGRRRNTFSYLGEREVVQRKNFARSKNSYVLFEAGFAAIHKMMRKTNAQN